LFQYNRYYTGIGVSVQWAIRSVLYMEGKWAPHFVLFVESLALRW